MIARIVKKPEIRKSEIISAAKILFLNKGVSDTSVSDIVKAVGVAQGTFYWHFKSKQEVLNAVVESMCDENVVIAEQIANSKDINALEKLLKIGNIFFEDIIDDNELIDQFHEASNKEVHDCVAGELSARIIPVLAKVIEQGIKEKVFDTPYPKQAAAFIFSSTQILNEGAVTDKKELDKWKEAVTDFALKGLGANIDIKK